MKNNGQPINGVSQIGILSSMLKNRTNQKKNNNQFKKKNSKISIKSNSVQYQKDYYSFQRKNMLEPVPSNTIKYYSNYQSQNINSFSKSLSHIIPQIKELYKKDTKSSSKKKKFAIEEDILLLQIVQLKGPKNWRNIASMIP